MKNFKGSSVVFLNINAPVPSELMTQSGTEKLVKNFSPLMSPRQTMSSSQKIGKRGDSTITSQEPGPRLSTTHLQKKPRDSHLPEPHQPTFVDQRELPRKSKKGNHHWGAPITLNIMKPRPMMVIGKAMDRGGLSCI